MSFSNPFEKLNPAFIFEAIEKQGFQPSGILYPLNSYENRVYEIQLENEEPIVAKFYRPSRWSLKSIEEEHHFIDQLDELEIPVVTPYYLDQPVLSCQSLGEQENFYYAIYPKFRGRENPDLNLQDREWLGRSLARLHNVGEHFVSKNRITLSPQTYGHESVPILLDQKFLPEDLHKHLHLVLNQAISLCEQLFKIPHTNILLHGDCHLGNVLWNSSGAYLLDFDDMVKAPAVQDLWMLLNGNEQEKEEQKNALLKGYETFRKFDENEFRLIEALRTLRMIRYAAWIGQRFEEDIFKKTFPYYCERKYWENFILQMKEQIAVMQDCF